MPNAASDQTRGYGVHGRVQGVGFRWATARVARRLGLHGWVRNLPDGTVQVAARGSLEALAGLEEFLARGPRAARVDRVVPEAPPETGLPETFEIRF